MSRVDIKGQVNLRNPIAMYRSTEEAKVDRETTAFSPANHPRNWEDFCDGIDSVLEDYTRMILSFKRYNIFFQILVTVVLVLFFSTNANRIVLMCMLPLGPTLSIFFTYFYCKEFSIWKRVEDVCTEKSGDGVRYELSSNLVGHLFDYHDKNYRIMVHFLDEGGQQNKKTWNDRWALSDPPPTADEEAQNRQTLNDRWGLSDPTPTALAAPSSGETESLFAQLTFS
jgi:hypothetical protein